MYFYILHWDISRENRLRESLVFLAASLSFLRIRSLFLYTKYNKYILLVHSGVGSRHNECIESIVKSETAGLFISVPINNAEINYRLKLSVINHFIFIIADVWHISLLLSRPFLLSFSPYTRVFGILRSLPLVHIDFHICFVVVVVQMTK